MHIVEFYYDYHGQQLSSRIPCNSFIEAKQLAKMIGQLGYEGFDYYIPASVIKWVQILYREKRT